MDIAIFIILSILLVWMIFYRFYSAKLDAACNRIKSVRLRNMVKILLKVTYVISVIVVVVVYVFKIVSLFSNKGDKT